MFLIISVIPNSCNENPSTTEDEERSESKSLLNCFSKHNQKYPYLYI